MIRVHVDAKRQAAIAIGTTPQDQHALSEIPYLKTNGSVGVTWWTYWKDLARDLRPDKLTGGVDLAELTEQVDQLGTVSNEQAAVIDSLFSNGITPYKYQRTGIQFLYNAKRVLLADSVGVGKTMQTLGLLGLLKREGSLNRALVICPTGLRHQWYSEATEKFMRDPPDFTVLSGAKAQRRHVWDSDWEVMICSPGMLINDMNLVLPMMPDVTLAVLDEASCIKNSETKTAKSLKDLVATVERRVALTATPIENRLADLLSIFQWVDSKVFPSVPYFNQRYVNWARRQFTVRKKNGNAFMVEKFEPAGYKNLDEVREKIRPVYLRRRVQDVGLEMPPLVVSREFLELPKKQREVYDKIRTKVLSGILGDQSSNRVRWAALISPLQGLRQACNSTALVEKKTSEKPSQVKVDRIKELLDSELADERVLLFTEYEKFARIIAKVLGQRAVTYTGKLDKSDRERAIRRFSSGAAQIMIATSAAERGLNLQCAGVLVNCDLPLNPAALKQRLGRIMRIGSAHQTVRMIDLITRDTVEEKLVLSKLYSKRKLFEDLLGEDELSEVDPLSGLKGSEVAKLI